MTQAVHTITPFGITLAEWGIMALAVIFLAEVFGFSRSTRTLRAQNVDLRERNQQLETEVKELQIQVTKLVAQVKDLESKSADTLIEMLKAHDAKSTEAMTAVAEAAEYTVSGISTALKQHEERALARHLELMTLFGVKLQGEKT